MALTTVNTTALSGTITNAQLAGSIDLTAKVTGTLPTGNGGTGSTATTFVNMTSNVTGTLPAANGGTGVTSYAPGKVLQVVTAVLSADVSFGATVGSWTEIQAVDITPSATSSKIFIIWSFLGQIGNGNYPGLKTRLLRDTTEIRGQTRLESYWGESSVTASINKRAYLSGNWLDSPSTTSAITYTMEGDNESGSAVTGTYQGAIKAGSGNDSSITVMEIA